MTMTRSRIRPSLCLAWVLGALLAACSVREGPAPRPVQRVTRPMMGTLVEVLWREAPGDRDRADQARAALDRMGELAAAMNLFDPGSELSRINGEAGKQPVKVSPEMMAVLSLALDVSSRTGGAFDVTVGSVEGLWGDIQHGGSAGRGPEGEARGRALAGGGAGNVVLNREAGTVFLPLAGTRLDLGGFAKGYIVDQGVERLGEGGLRCFMINAGGDIRCSGCGQPVPPWKVGLQDPFEKGALLGVFRVRGEAVVTSGSYERYFENAQGRFSHIMDPKTGRPARGPVSVTVVAATAAEADGLATAFMVTGRQGALPVLRRMEAVRTVFVDADGTIWLDDRLQGMFQAGPLARNMTLRTFRASSPASAASPAPAP